MAQTGKAGAVRLCTYRCSELGPHLLMRTGLASLECSHHPSKPEILAIEAFTRQRVPRFSYSLSIALYR